MYQTVRRHIIALRSGSGDRPSFLVATGSVPTEYYSLTEEGAELAELSEDQIGQPYMAALLNCGPPLPVLRRLSLRGTEAVRALAAKFIDCEDVLLEVADSTSSTFVALGVARNKSTATEEVLLTLLDGPALSGYFSSNPPFAKRIGNAILNHKSCTKRVIEKLARPFEGPDFFEYESIQTRVADSSRLSEDLARRISKRQAAEVLARNPVLQFLIASNPALLPDLSYEVQREIVARADASQHLLREAARTGSKGIRKTAALHDNLPDDAYDPLVKDEMMMVRRAAAKRRDLPRDLFLVLSKDSHPMVRQTIARNEGCPRDLVVRLADDAAGSVRAAAAGHPECPPRKLAELADDDRDAVRKRVAGNPAAPKPKLRSLAADGERQIRTQVAKNESTPPAILERLAGMDRFSVRLAAAGNLSTPPSTLRELVETGREEDKIRRHAQATLQTQATLRQEDC